MTPQQKLYFDNMSPNQTITPSQVKNWDDLIAAAKEYIDMGGGLTFNDDYSILTKDNSIPQNNQSIYFFEF